MREVDTIIFIIETLMGRGDMVISKAERLMRREDINHSGAGAPANKKDTLFPISGMLFRRATMLISPGVRASTKTRPPKIRGKGQAGKGFSKNIEHAGLNRHKII